MSGTIIRRSGNDRSKRRYSLAIASPGVAPAEGVRPVGPGHCVANCPTGGGGVMKGSGGGGGGGGSGGGGGWLGVATGVIQGVSTVSTIATQEAIRNARDKVQQKKDSKK